MSKLKYGYQVDTFGAHTITGDGSGVALPEVVDGEYPSITLTSNAPDTNAAIRYLFEEQLVLIMLLAPADDVRTANHIVAARQLLNALLAARG